MTTEERTRRWRLVLGGGVVGGLGAQEGTEVPLTLEEIGRAHV